MSKHFNIQSISHQLAGIAYQEDKAGQKTTCFIDGALPNEKVEAKLIDSKNPSKNKKNVEHWQVVNVIEPSSARIQPECKWANQCGGCQASHIAHDDQIVFKQNAITEQLSRVFAGKSIEILPAIKSQTWQYRRRARLAYQFQNRSRKASLGFRERKSSSIVNMDACIALEARLSDLIPELRVFCESELSDPSCIGHIELISPSLNKRKESIDENKESVDENKKPIVLLRLVKRLTDSDLAKLTQFKQEHRIRVFVQQPQPKSETYSNVKDSDGILDLTVAADANQLVEIIDSQNVKDYPRVFYTLNSGIEVEFTPLDFIQANAEVNNQMIELVLNQLALTESSKVFEFFAGVGNFTLPLASTGAKIDSFELVKSSVERAKHNAKQAGFDQVNCHQIDLTDKTKMQSQLKGGCDVIVLDPPRTGAAELLSFLPATKAKQIVYVSCNPTTLSRDARELKQFGYQLESAGLIDMFPNTPHAEAIAIFKRQSGADLETSKKKGKKKRGGKNVFGF